MKISVSLPDDDAAFLDKYAATHPDETRSSAIQLALAEFRKRLRRTTRCAGSAMKITRSAR